MKSSSLCHTATACAVVIALISILTPISQADPILRWGHSWTAQSQQKLELKTAGRKEAHTLVAHQALSITSIAVYGDTTRAGTPIYRIGVQGDDGTTNHYPDGNWVGGSANYADTALPSSGWQTVLLPSAAVLTKGVRYHLVVETESADASNYSSIRHIYQPSAISFRVFDGVYDGAVGRESFNGTIWSRASSMAIVAIDTTTGKAIGQPWTAGENYFSLSKDWRYGQTFTLDIPVEPTAVELVSLAVNIPSIYQVPDDDLRVQLYQVGETTPLLAMVLINKNNLPAAGMISVETLPVKLRAGVAYRLVLESTNVNTAVGYYKVSTCVGALVTDYAQAPEATFQGSAGSFISSFRNGNWTAKTAVNTGATDLVFELKLRIPSPRTLLTVR